MPSANRSDCDQCGLAGVVGWVAGWLAGSTSGAGAAAGIGMAGTEPGGTQIAMPTAFRCWVGMPTPTPP